MHVFLWAAHIALAAVVGWFGLTWLIYFTSPESGYARLAFVAALGAGSYATFALLTYAVCLILWPAAPQRAMRYFSQLEGLLCAVFACIVLMLYMVSDLNWFTLAFTALLFIAIQYFQLRTT